MSDDRKAPSQTYPKDPKDFTLVPEQKAPDVLDTAKGAPLIK